MNLKEFLDKLDSMGFFLMNINHVYGFVEEEGISLTDTIVHEILCKTCNHPAADHMLAGKCIWHKCPCIKTRNEAEHE